MRGDAAGSSSSHTAGGGLARSLGRCDDDEEADEAGIKKENEGAGEAEVVAVDVGRELLDPAPP